MIVLHSKYNNPHIFGLYARIWFLSIKNEIPTEKQDVGNICIIGGFLGIFSSSAAVATADYFGDFQGRHISIINSQQ